jgi:hypothetical protein
MTDQLPAYSVSVSRENELWVAVVDGIPGGATDVERFEDLPNAVEDLIATLTDTDAGNFWVEWQYRQGDHDLTELIIDLRQWEKQAKIAALNRDAARSALVRAMRSAGFSYREIGDVIGVSFQRVGQLLDAADATVVYRVGTATLHSRWTRELADKLRNVAIHGVHLDAGKEYLSPLEAALVLLLDTARLVRPDSRRGLLSTTAEVLGDVAADDEFIRHG